MDRVVEDRLRDVSPNAEKSFSGPQLSYIPAKDQSVRRLGRRNLSYERRKPEALALVDALVQSGAARREGDWLHNT